MNALKTNVVSSITPGHPVAEESIAHSTLIARELCRRQPITVPFTDRHFQVSLQVDLYCSSFIMPGSQQYALTNSRGEASLAEVPLRPR